MPTLKLGDPGTYTVALNVVGLTQSSTIQVANVAPTIQQFTDLQPGYASARRHQSHPPSIDPGTPTRTAA